MKRRVFLSGLLGTIGAGGIFFVADPDSLHAQSQISYFIADGRGQRGFRVGDVELAGWALQAWQRSAADGLRLHPTTEAAALIRLYWVEPNDGRYGETREVNVNGTRGAEVFIQPDVSLLGSDIARRAAEDALFRDSVVYLTCLHEVGHALGLPHTRDERDIMYYFGFGGDVVQYFERYRGRLRSRADIAMVPGLSDGDIRKVRIAHPR